MHNGSSPSRKIFPGIPLIESPLFAQIADRSEWSAYERSIAQDLHERGYAVLDFPDDQIEEKVERIKGALAPEFAAETPTEGVFRPDGGRIQDAWKFNEDVHAVATNEIIIALLGKLYGRQAIPFQTLNFPVGTQQHFHSDSIHFSSIPERFMCGVWLALEDISDDAGPLFYYPGSHKWPIVTNEMIGRVSHEAEDAQSPYEPAWRALVDSSGVQPERFCPRKGQALIWTANLLHGGSPRTNPSVSRWSQVTHYYFENCTYYTPAFSDPFLNKLQIRSIQDIRTGETVENLYLENTYSSMRVPDPSPPKKKSPKWKFW
jgi:hypothetical protein